MNVLFSKNHINIGVVYIIAGLIGGKHWIRIKFGN